MKKIFLLLVPCFLITAAHAQFPVPGVVSGGAVTRNYGVDTIAGYIARDTGTGYAGFVSFAGGKYSEFLTDTNGDGLI